MTRKPAAPGHRVKVPTVIQMEAVECGAASLGMILGYYGRSEPLEELRAACGVSRDGAKAANILTAAQNYGLKAEAFRKETADLRTMTFPVVVFWNFNHFLVVEGFGRNKVYLSDPAVGRRSVGLDEFDRSFTGVVLTFEPGPDFEEKAAGHTFLNQLLRRLKGAGPALTLAVLAGLFLVVPGLLVPTFTRVFVDQVLLAGRTDVLPWLLIAMLIVTVLMAALTWVQQYYLLRLETAMSLKTSAAFLWHLLRLPMDFYSQRFAGGLVTRVQTNDTIATLLSGQFATAMIGILSIVFYAAVMFSYDVVLTLIGILFAALNFLALQYISGLRIERNQVLVQQQNLLAGASFGGVTGIETLKATAAEQDFFSRWAGYQAKAVNAEQQLGALTQALNVVPALLSILATAAILIIGGLRVIEGDLSYGMLVAFQGLMVAFLAPFTQLVTMGSNLQDAKGEMDQIDDVMDNPLDRDVIRDVTDPVPAPDEPVRLQGYVEMKNVSFGYNRAGKPLITDFSLSLKPGDRVALVGATGAGKSTIGMLISGLLDPWSGEILFDGKPRSAWSRRVLTRSLGRVSQEIFLFAGTVRDNISLWDEAVPHPAILDAARDAQVAQTILARPGGFDGPVMEGGANFSGGEGQRMEIARALAAQPSVLVLDEATAALDPTVELEIDTAIRRRGYTCVIVAHRLSTIRDCNEIIVLDRGQVVQRGTHEELVKDPDGLYLKLVQTE